MKARFIKFKKTFTHEQETEHVNIRGPGRFTVATFKIMKGSILEVWVDEDNNVWIDQPGRAGRADDRLDVPAEYYEFYE